MHKDCEKYIEEIRKLLANILNIIFDTYYFLK